MNQQIWVARNLNVQFNDNKQAHITNRVQTELADFNSSDLSQAGQQYRRFVSLKIPSVDVDS